MRVPQEPQARESSMIQVTSACSDYQETLRMPTEIFPCLLLMEWTRLPLGVGGAAQWKKKMKWWLRKRAISNLFSSHDWDPGIETGPFSCLVRRKHKCRASPFSPGRRAKQEPFSHPHRCLGLFFFLFRLLGANRWLQKPGFQIYEWKFKQMLAIKMACKIFFHTMFIALPPSHKWEMWVIKG